jgi:hypothetical protein
MDFESENANSCDPLLRPKRSLWKPPIGEKVDYMEFHRRMYDWLQRPRKMDSNGKSFQRHVDVWYKNGERWYRLAVTHIAPSVYDMSSMCKMGLYCFNENETIGIAMDRCHFELEDEE